MYVVTVNIINWLFSKGIANEGTNVVTSVVRKVTNSLVFICFINAAKDSDCIGLSNKNGNTN